MPPHDHDHEPAVERIRSAARPVYISTINALQQIVVAGLDVEGKLHLEGSALMPGAARSSAPAILTAC
jgi:hypothetical protein